MNEIGVTIANQPFPHLLYHFVLTYSNWEWVTICQSESFEALSMGVQDALWQLGAVPQRHKTDNLSAAVKDLQGRKVFTDKYEALMNHYGLAKFTNTPGEANENGDVEQSHRQLVRAMKTEFLLRGSKNFESVEAYRAFLEAVVERRNGNRRTKLLEEMNVMRELPSKRLDDFSLEEVRVSQYSTLQIRRNTYSLDSRYIGEKLRVYVYENRLQLWHAGKQVIELPRLKGKGKICINYRHMIDSLVKKPGAFRNYKYQEALFPTLIFRATYDWLVQHKQASADREYVNILYLAAKEGQNLVEQVCRKYLYEGKPISAEAVKGQLSQGEEPQAKVDQVKLTTYDQLLAGGYHG